MTLQRNKQSAAAALRETKIKIYETKIYCHPPPGCDSLSSHGKSVSQRERDDDGAKPGFSVRRAPQARHAGRSRGPRLLRLRLERGEPA